MIPLSHKGFIGCIFRYTDPFKFAAIIGGDTKRV
jgi:hypothetical protein